MEDASEIGLMVPAFLGLKIASGSRRADLKRVLTSFNLTACS